MKCPNCGQENPDGTMICQGCDFILDQSFLEEDGLDGDYASEDTPPGDVADEDLREEYDEEWHEAPTEHFEDGDLEGPATHQTTPGGSYSRPGTKKTRQQQIDEDAEPDEFDDEIERQRAAMRARRSKVSAIEEQRKLQQQTALRSTQAPTLKSEGLAVEASQVGHDMENMLLKAKDFFKKLGSHEQIALIGCLLAFLSTIFPWVEIEQQGSQIGLEMGGVFIMLLSAGTGLLIYLSGQQDWLPRRQILIYLEAALAGIALLFGLSKIFTSLSFTVVSPADGTTATYAGSIQFGLLLTLAGTGAMAAGIGLLIKNELFAKKKDKIT